MPIAFSCVFLCIKQLDKNENLPAGQTRMLVVVHWPQFLLCLFWLWTFARLESPFLTGNVFSQVGQQCQTDLKEVVLSYISFEVIFLFSLKVTCFKLSEAIRDDLLSLSEWQPPHCSVSGCSDFNFTFGKVCTGLICVMDFPWSTLISRIFE